MAQAGIHGMAAMAVRKAVPNKECLLLGIVLGSIMPDLDNYAVAGATLLGLPSEGLHRTFTHSLFFVGALILIGYLISSALKQPRIGNLGLGLGIGVLMHIAFDLLIWFNGVEILWPIPSWVNFWENVSAPEWFMNLLMPMEFLFLGLFLRMIAGRAEIIGTDTALIPGARRWATVLFGFFLVFTILLYAWEAGFFLPYGAAYLITATLVAVYIVRMRATVDSHR